MPTLNYTHSISKPQIQIASSLNSFQIRCRSQNLSSGTIRFYEIKLSKFVSFVKSIGISEVLDITPTTIREYLLFLQDSGHNGGGRHAHFRAIRTFLYWYENEYEPEDWKNPITKVKAPKVIQEPLDPISLYDIQCLIGICNKTIFTDLRDRAIIFILLDTGVRANELLSLNIEDINLSTGHIQIKNGKGGKYRTVIIGQTSAKSLSTYLDSRCDNNRVLFVTQPQSGSTRLTYFGLRSMIKRRSLLAGINTPTLHSFRRAFALSMLRSGIDLYTLQKLMGHASIDTLKHYLKQTTEDIRRAHERYGPVDNVLSVSMKNEEK